MRIHWKYAFSARRRNPEKKHKYVFSWLKSVDRSIGALCSLQLHVRERPAAGDGLPHRGAGDGGQLGRACRTRGGSQGRRDHGVARRGRHGRGGFGRRRCGSTVTAPGSGEFGWMPMAERMAAAHRGWGWRRRTAAKAGVGDDAVVAGVGGADGGATGDDAGGVHGAARGGRRHWGEARPVAGKGWQWLWGGRRGSGMHGTPGELRLVSAAGRDGRARRHHEFLPTLGVEEAGAREAQGRVLLLEGQQRRGCVWAPLL